MVGVEIRDLEVHSRWIQLFDTPSENYNVGMKFLARETVLPDLCQMFSSGKPVYIMTREEADEYLALKHEKEVREAEKEEEENNEECD